ncbi:hypothetical protein [Labrenzia sp. DG1229]|uniref:hypothetical protein n=1 Tax=Labrenzia sp. DG1229 TaxID=681847 RepID=UPI0012EC3D70|nr:hypothetical protein [Labrenzia sp. DG1229]
MSRSAVSFRESMLRALDEERFDDLVLMLANRMRLRQDTISPHTRASLPIDSTKTSPLRSTKLSEAQIATYDIRDKGWHLIAVKGNEIQGAERFAVRGDDPNYRDKLYRHMESVLRYYGEDALVLAAYHVKGVLVEWQFLSDFRAEPRNY